MNTDISARRIRVYGIVQGVGFRPTVSRHAIETGVTGYVSNCGPYVEIVAQGTAAQVDAFQEAVIHRPPVRAVILKTDSKPIEVSDYQDFQIVESEKTTGEIFISPDIAMCETCREELFDSTNRRYLHPFINCTCCGPRMTILEGLPYDRIRTSMKVFPMCSSCAAEYTDPKTRRYDAQPVCCNDCGPTVYVLDAEDSGRSAITKARGIIMSGGTVAVKGIGGFHLCCDAKNPEAVSRLRAHKQRLVKPFAVMLRDMDAVRRECETKAWQEEILTGHQKPILLLKKRQEGCYICEETAPGNPKLGVMLPYAPLQALLFDYDDGISMTDCLVMTSANESGAPIVRDDEGARTELSGLSDLILSHDRQIRIRADDTVMDTYHGEPYMIRRSRGYAPLPVWTSYGFKGQVLAVGGELKNTFCIGTGDLFYPSPYIGDLSDIRTVEALEETIGRFSSMLEVHPKVIAADLHPGYHSTALAGRMAEETGADLIKVQHHFAHIVSCMVENDYHDEVIGLSFDGTGYGMDGTIWGGELLRCSLSDFERLGSITPFLMTGGDAAAREGWRIAVSMLYEELKDQQKVMRIAERLGLCEPKQARMLMMMADHRINSVVSTSAGRLFDAVSAVLGICRTSTFEGEAATSLQYAAMAAGDISFRQEWTASCKDPMQMDTRGLFMYLVRERLAGRQTPGLARFFHRALAEMMAQAVCAAREATGLQTAALSGGVFQNTLLLDLTEKALKREDIKVLRHHLIPPNDGGIALGQAVVCQARMKQKEGSSCV